MGVYDIYGNLITVGSTSGSPVEDSGIRNIPFENWTAGTLNQTTGGYTTSNTNYCLPLSYGMTIKAGEWLMVPSSVSPIDFSYKRFVNGVAEGGFLADGTVAGNTRDYVRGAVEIFEIPYDGVYTFNFYVGGNTQEEAKAAINSLTIYSAEYAESHRKELFGGQDSHSDFMRTIAHKGISCALGVENTMPVFKQAVKRGYVSVETDLRVTSDNIPVLCHDATFGGLTIADSTLAELQAVTVGTGVWEATIPTFDEFMYWAKCNNVEVYLDCKISTEEATDLYFAVVKKYGMLDRVTWFGNPGYVITLDECARVGTFSTGINPALLTGKNEVIIDPQVSSITEEIATAAIEAGGKVECYSTPGVAADVIAMSKIGVTGMTVEKLHCQAIIESQ